jgi:glycosyltransferase involved in cell wall biosynthesis
VILGVDASNIRSGGGLTHLAELLRAADPAAHGFSRVIVWSGRKTLDRIDAREWLVKSHQPALNCGLVRRSRWQRSELSALAVTVGCDLLFIPGGSFVGQFRPFVTMNQNLLPFEPSELRRYGWSRMTLKLLMLRFVQGRTLARADGAIFLTAHAKEVVSRAVGGRMGSTTVIPHGMAERFFVPPRDQVSIDHYSPSRPFRVLYVSIIDMYKHQWKVAEAVAQLRAEGLPVALDLVGPAYPPALSRLEAATRALDPAKEFIRYVGPIPHDELVARYVQSDVGVFASSCETFGQIVTEMMAAGVPIACSNRSAMPELLGAAGEYFEPDNPSDIAAALRRLIDSPQRRADAAREAHATARAFSWERCANDTFAFLSGVARASS